MIYFFKQLEKHRRSVSRGLGFFHDFSTFFLKSMKSKKSKDDAFLMYPPLMGPIFHHTYVYKAHQVPPTDASHFPVIICFEAYHLPLTDVAQNICVVENGPHQWGVGDAAQDMLTVK